MDFGASSHITSDVRLLHNLRVEEDPVIVTLATVSSACQLAALRSMGQLSVCSWQVRRVSWQQECRTRGVQQQRSV